MSTAFNAPSASRSISRKYAASWIYRTYYMLQRLSLNMGCMLIITRRPVASSNSHRCPSNVARAAPSGLCTFSAHLILPQDFSTPPHAHLSTSFHSATRAVRTIFADADGSKPILRIPTFHSMIEASKFSLTAQSRYFLPSFKARGVSRAVNMVSCDPDVLAFPRSYTT